MRFSPIFLAFSALSFGGCNGGSTYGLWVLTLDTPTTSGSTSCDENYNHARCIQDDGGSGDSHWNYTDTTKVSSGLQFVEILEGEGDGAFIVYGDKVYPGTTTKSGFNFEWKANTQADHSEDYEGDYEYVSDLNTVVDTTFALSLGKGAGTMTGSLTQKVTSTKNVKETDQPNNDNTLGFVGQINSDATTLLENTDDPDSPDGRINTAADEECQASDCEIAVVVNTTDTWKLTGAFATDQSIGDIGNYQDVSQDPGAGEGDVLLPAK